jgi:predicted nicotinamide N-methyase
MLVVPPLCFVLILGVFFTLAVVGLKKLGLLAQNAERSTKPSDCRKMAASDSTILEELPSPPQRPSMTALLAGGVAMRRQSGGPAKSRLDKMMGALQWRHAHLTSEEYPLEIGGVSLKIKQLMQGELTGLGTGATVWPAAHVLSKYMEHRWPLKSGGMKGLRVIDLGSGTGAVGLVARILGAEVVLTDQEQLSFLMHENTSRALEAMNLSALASGSASEGVTVATYDWGLDDNHLSPPFDVVIVSDCVLPKLYPIEPLVSALVELTKPRGDKQVSPIVLLSYEHRIHEHFDPRVRRGGVTYFI